MFYPHDDRAAAKSTRRAYLSGRWLGITSADSDLLQEGLDRTGVIQQYLRAGLLDELLLSVVPVLLGGGVRLLDGLGDAPGELERTWVGESPSGVTHLRYAVRSPGSAPG